jgi:hypothetical protein
MQYSLNPTLAGGGGRGRVARWHNVVAFVPADSPAAQSLFGWCRLVGERRAEHLVSELCDLSTSRPLGDVCVLVTDESGQVTMLVGGALTIGVDTGTTRYAVAGAGAALRVQRIGDAALTIGDHPLDTSITLEAGVIAADGFAWRPVGARPPVALAAPDMPEPDPHDAPATPVAVAAPAALVSLVDLAVEDPELPPLEPLPVRAAAESCAPVDVAVDTVQGVRCSRDHFNDPRARFCAVCGIAMHQTSFVVTEAPRPPLGVLVFNDGTYHTLVRGVVLGRDPVDDADVRAGRVDTIVLAAGGGSISRVHAEIRASGWDVHIVDRGSTNGTFVAAPGRSTWDRIPANTAVALTPGTRVSFGSLSASFESANRQRA